MRLQLKTSKSHNKKGEPVQLPNTSVKRDRLPACRLQTAPYLKR